MSDNRCVCCGCEIPEGRQVCPMCEKEAGKMDKADCRIHECVIAIALFGLIIIMLLKVLS